MLIEPNKIYNVDSYQAIKEMPDKCVDLIITDPPYDIKHTEGGGMLIDKGIKQMFDDLVEDNLQVGIDESILEEMCRVMKKINIYIWCNKIMIPMLFDFFVNKKKCLFDIIVWQKVNSMPLCGSKYLTDCEYCLYFRESRKLNTTYDTAKTVYQIPINIKDKNDYEHPTIKPLEPIKNFIINSSDEGDIVFDPFLGSGTTAVASKELNRKYIGFEISEKYCKIAEDRVKGITVQERKAKDKGVQNIFDFLYTEN